MKSRDVVAFVFAFEGEPERFLLPVLGIPAFELILRSLRGAGIERIFLFTDLPQMKAAAEEGSIEVLDPREDDIERAIRGNVIFGIAGDLPLLTPKSIGAFIDRFDPFQGGLLRVDGAPLFLSLIHI